MKKYAVVGSHGAGKSSLAYMMACRFKRLGKNVDIVQERVRYSPFPFNSEMTAETALWVYHTHIARELEAQARGANIVVCDRSALDSFIYAEHFNLLPKHLSLTKQHAMKWLESYNQLFFIRPDIEISDDGIRGLDKDYQKHIDELFDNHLTLIKQYLNINLVTLKSSQIFNKDFDIGDFLDVE